MNKTEITEIHQWMVDLDVIHNEIKIKSNTYSGASYGFFAGMGDDHILRVIKEWRDANERFEAIWTTLTADQKRYWYEWQAQKGIK